MLGPHRETAKPKRRKLLADRSLMHDHAEAVFNPAIKVDATPAHHTVNPMVGALTHHLRQFRPLLRVQQRLRTR